MSAPRRDKRQEPAPHWPRLASISGKPSCPKEEEYGATEEDQRLVVQVMGECVGGEKQADESSPRADVPMVVPVHGPKIRLGREADADL